MCGFLRLLMLCLCMSGAYGSGSKDFTGSKMTNYAEVRSRVAHSFPEKANEIADIISVLQDLSKATVDMTEKISAHCSQ